MHVTLKLLSLGLVTSLLAACGGGSGGGQSGEESGGGGAPLIGVFVLVYSAGQVFAEKVLDEGGWELDVELDRRDYEQLLSKEGLQFTEQKDKRHTVASC